MSIREVTFRIKSLSPYSPSRALQSEKPQNETHDAFDRRVWREHITTDKDGNVIVPIMAFKWAISAAAKLNPIKRKGQTMWTKAIDTGVRPMAPLSLGIKSDSVESERFYCHADGRRGSGTRVWRTFPMIYDWGGTAQMAVLNPEIPNNIIEQYLRDAGLYIGVGRFRPEVLGVNGTWKVEDIKWRDLAS